MPIMSHVREMARRLATDERKLERIREKTAETTKMAIEVAAVGGASFALAYANGRFGDQSGVYQIGGRVPVDLTAAVLLHAAAFGGGFGSKYAELGHSLGNGALAEYLARIGRDMGAQAKGGAAAAGNAGWNVPMFAGHAPTLWPNYDPQAAYRT